MIKYPNGNSFQKINSSLLNEKKTDYSKRGMNLENAINEANEYYLTRNIAVIHKKPTPINIVKVSYPKRAAAKITEAYFAQASTTDYNGIYQGKYIDFDAKETKSKTSFPLSNFHKHQIDHLSLILQQGGIGFVIIAFVTLNETFILSADKLIIFWNNSINGGRKSIPYKYIKTNGVFIEPDLIPQLPYLKAVDNMI